MIFKSKTKKQIEKRLQLFFDFIKESDLEVFAEEMMPLVVALKKIYETEVNDRKSNTTRSKSEKISHNVLSSMGYIENKK